MQAVQLFGRPRPNDEISSPECTRLLQLLALRKRCRLHPSCKVSARAVLAELCCRVLLRVRPETATEPCTACARRRWGTLVCLHARGSYQQAATVQRQSNAIPVIAFTAEREAGGLERTEYARWPIVCNIARRAAANATTCLSRKRSTTAAGTIRATCLRCNQVAGTARSMLSELWACRAHSQT